MRSGFIKLCCVLITLTITTIACKNNHTPKPRGYHRINFPDRAYQTFDTKFPYQFQYPKYATIKSDTSAKAEEYWLNIVFPEFKGQVHLSYKAIDNNLFELMEDGRKLAYKHTIKADAINESMFYNEKSKVLGVLYEIKGNAASPLQFYATDSTRHFIRGSLYFNVIPNQDSLAPVISFVRDDIMHLMETIEWN